MIGDFHFLYYLSAMSTNSFTTIYKSFSNKELYEVIQNKNDYQPAAAEAAIVEFQNRNLSDDELTILENDWQLLQQQKHQRLEKK